MKKSIKWIIIGIVICLVGVILVIVLKPKSSSEIDTSIVLELEKYNDNNAKLTQVLDVTIEDDYLVVSGYNRLNSNYYFYAYKNGEKINFPTNLDNENVRKIRMSNKYVAVLNDKYHLVDYKNGTIDSKEYDYIADEYYGKYLAASIDSLEGIIDLNGNTIIPIEYNYIYGNENIKEKELFKAGKKDKGYILDKNNKTIISSNNPLNISNMGYIKEFVGDNVINYYSLEGKLVKELNVTDKETYANTIEYLTNHEVFVDKKNVSTIYVVDNKLNVTKFENVFYAIEEGYDIESGDSYDNYIYYITDSIIVTQEGNEYIVKSIDTGKELYKYNYIKYLYINGESDETNSVLIACKAENKCGLLDENGKEKTSFDYDLEIAIGKTFSAGDEEALEYLKKNNEYVLIPGGYGDVKTISCEKEDLLKSVFITNEYYFIRYDNYIKNVYNNKCEKLNEKPLLNHEYLNDGILLAEIEEAFNTKDGVDIRDYYVIYQGNLIKYNKPEDLEIYTLLGYNNKKIYFSTNKGFYYLDLAKLYK